jgi:hypothetical protein
MEVQSKQMDADDDAKPEPKAMEKLTRMNLTLSLMLKQWIFLVRYNEVLHVSSTSWRNGVLISFLSPCQTYRLIICLVKPVFLVVFDPYLDAFQLSVSVVAGIEFLVYVWFYQTHLPI